MLVKIYRYRIRPERADAFLELQKQADQIYRRHVSYKVSHFRSQTDKAAWTEVHWYRDDATAAKADGLTKVEPELKRLFDEFLAMLDPADPAIHEELFDDLSIRPH